MDYSLSINIPAYNDEKSIEALVGEAHDIAGSIVDKFQILIINDGSKDGTKEQLERLRQIYTNIKVVHHRDNLGFAETFKEIFSNQDCDVNFIIPGDGQIKPIILLELWSFLKEYDFILGCRKMRRDNLKRRISSFIYNLLISVICKRRIRDVNSAVLYKSKVMDDIKLDSRSALIHAEFLIRVLKKGYKICEVPIEHYPRASGIGSGGKFSVIFDTILELIKKWGNLNNYR